jgi:hypothetical protein
VTALKADALAPADCPVETIIGHCYNYVMLKHAAELVLAIAWLVITPPYHSDGPEEGAPLSRWERRATFRTKAACERYVQDKRDHARNAGLDIWCSGADCARCIDAAEYRRLKSAGQ